MGMHLRTKRWRYSNQQKNEARRKNVATTTQHKTLVRVAIRLETSMTDEQADHNQIQVQFLPGFPILALSSLTEVHGQKCKRYDPAFVSGLWEPCVWSKLLLGLYRLSTIGLCLWLRDPQRVTSWV